MSIFGDSTPDFETPEQDTVDETAETQEVEDQQEEQQEQAETEETTTEDQEEQDSTQEHSDELLAGKYKSVEELVKGYKSLEQQFHQTRQQPGQQTTTPDQKQQPAVDHNEIFWENFKENPLGTMQFLVDNVVSQKTAPIYEQREQEIFTKNLTEVAKDFKQTTTDDGFKALMGRVQEIAQEFGNPGLAKNPTPRVLQMAAKELWGDSAAPTYKKATEQGRIDSENARKAKMGLNVAVTKKQETAPRTEADEILEGMRSHSGRRGLF
ncbi:MAG: hypothetical protein JW384_03064 [Nitrosomonadaceae bacterium]|nr:hypothetical protein [Nitrosomonadaceae bacterium]